MSLLEQIIEAEEQLEIAVKEKFFEFKTKEKNLVKLIQAKEEEHQILLKKSKNDFSDFVVQKVKDLENDYQTKVQRQQNQFQKQLDEKADKLFQDALERILK